MSKGEKKSNSGYYTEKTNDAKAHLPADFIKQVKDQLNDAAFIRKRKSKPKKQEENTNKKVDRRT